jgi:aminoglycoside phosphotransferase (APT) family kinase protein
MPGSVPPWLTTLFGVDLRGAAPLRWGFHNETWRVRLVDGRTLAATRLADDGTPRHAVTVLAVVGQRLAEAGLPVPSLVGPWTFESDRVLVAEFIDGMVGADLLSEPNGPQLIGRLAGSVIRSLGAVDPTGLAIASVWADAHQLARAAARWSRVIRPALSIADRRRLAAAVGLVPLLLADRPRVLVHGDLAPVNLLVRDGRLCGLLDLEAVRLADPLFDAAWFDWLMRFHHPAQRDEAWIALVESAGLDLEEPGSAELRHVLPTLRILERVAVSGRPVDRLPQRLTQLRASLDPLPS